MVVQFYSVLEKFCVLITKKNVAYPSGMCAERVALFYASSKYPNSKILKIAVSARSDVFKINDMISPCGSCRQVIAEYERKQGSYIEIILHVNDDKILVFEKASGLLPLVFDSPPLENINLDHILETPIVYLKSGAKKS